MMATADRGFVAAALAGGFSGLMDKVPIVAEPVMLTRLFCQVFFLSKAVTSPNHFYGVYQIAFVNFFALIMLIRTLRNVTEHRLSFILVYLGNLTD